MVTKIPLSARKNFRDAFEVKVPELQARLAAALGDGSDYTLEPNSADLYTHLLAAGAGYGDKLGVLASAYFDAAVCAVEALTDGGKDADAVTAFRTLTGQNSTVLAPADDVAYCAARFADGVFALVYNPKQIWLGVRGIGDELVANMDKSLLDAGELPLSTRRIIKQVLEPAIAHFQQTFMQMFGKDFRAEYDVAATLAAMKTQYFAKDGAEKWYGKWPRYVPETIGKYYTALARGLESGGFGKDELLSKSFTELAKKNIVKFQVVHTLPSDRKYNCLTFEDGVVNMYTTAEWFGSNVGAISDGVNQLL